MKKQFYVQCKDTFMSGWGLAKNKNNILIFICDSEEEQDIVFDNIKNRTDMINGKKTLKMPVLDHRKNYVQLKSKKDYSKFYQKDYVKEQKERLQEY